MTAIELLSPSNKVPTDGRELYLRKQREYLHSGVNFVEIDLLRTGYHTLAVDREKLRPQQRTPYLICVRRASRPWEAEVYPATYREPPIVLQPARRGLFASLANRHTKEPAVRTARPAAG